MVSVLTWQSWADLPTIVAMVLGTVGMFLLRGVPMRVFLGLAALAWTLSHILVGSVGGRRSAQVVA
ncbi:YgjV family protein [Arhodomonas aquaeolei]|uniref:YgjV family protein n=1 Tax=Arhodomonas aquaeolei TaxID=2369 RepID=UPI0035B68C74